MSSIHYDETPPSSAETHLAELVQRRRDQNRVAQRAFRARQARHAAELETEIARLECKSQGLRQENKRLRIELDRLVAYNTGFSAALQATPTSQEILSASSVDFLVTYDVLDLDYLRGPS